jgi:O-methyltransferase involved in polyketide biosynthesis
MSHSQGSPNDVSANRGTRRQPANFVERAELARVAAAVMPQVALPANPSIADPAAWLAAHGWQAHIYDVAERFQAYGRATPMMFSPAASTMPARRLATAARM